jgi:hypothetical protein
MSPLNALAQKSERIRRIGVLMRYAENSPAARTGPWRSSNSLKSLAGHRTF